MSAVVRAAHGDSSATAGALWGDSPVGAVVYKFAGAVVFGGNFGSGPITASAKFLGVKYWRSDF